MQPDDIVAGDRPDLVIAERRQAAPLDDRLDNSASPERTAATPP